MATSADRLAGLAEITESGNVALDNQTIGFDENTGASISRAMMEPNMKGSIVEPAKKSKVGLVLAVILLIMLIAAGGFGVFFILNSPKSTPKTSSVEPPKRAEEVGLVCTYTSDETGQNYSNRLVANYFNGELVDISMVESLQYNTPEEAAESRNLMHAAYLRLLQENSLTTDPFVSNYSVSSDNYLTVSHYAEYTKIDGSNAFVFGLDIAENEPKTDMDSVEAKYTEGGYTCRRSDGSVNQSDVSTQPEEERVAETKVNDSGTSEPTEEGTEASATENTTETPTESAEAPAEVETAPVVEGSDNSEVVQLPE